MAGSVGRIEVNAEGIFRNTAVLDSPKARKALRDVVNNAAWAIADYAKRHHDYEDRTGKTTDSIRVSGSSAWTKYVTVGTVAGKVLEGGVARPYTISANGSTSRKNLFRSANAYKSSGGTYLKFRWPEANKRIKRAKDDRSKVLLEEVIHPSMPPTPFLEEARDAVFRSGRIDQFFEKRFDELLAAANLRAMRKRG